MSPPSPSGVPALPRPTPPSLGALERVIIKEELFWVGLRFELGHLQDIGSHRDQIRCDRLPLRTCLRSPAPPPPS
jgi:hypothetical protein